MTFKQQKQAMRPAFVLFGFLFRQLLADGFCRAGIELRDLFQSAFTGVLLVNLERHRIGLGDLWLQSGIRNHLPPGVEALLIADAPCPDQQRNRRYGRLSSKCNTISQNFGWSFPTKTFSGTIVD